MDAANWIKHGLGAAALLAASASAGDAVAADQDRLTETFKVCVLHAMGQVVGKDLSRSNPEITAGDGVIEIDLDLAFPQPSNAQSLSMAAIWTWKKGDPPPVFNGEGTLLSFYDITEIAKQKDGTIVELQTGGIAESFNGEYLQTLDYALKTRNPALMPEMRQRSEDLNREILTCNNMAIS